MATLFPAGDRLPAADPDVLLPDLDAHPRLARALRLGLAWLALRYRLRHGGAFHRAGAERRAAFIEGLTHRPLSGRLLRALCLPFKARYLLDERVEAAAGRCPPRWSISAGGNKSPPPGTATRTWIWKRTRW
ncbi:hypothetical protein Y5W_00910 [Alcanivorax sp. 521-1]|uniref:Uncharacterized protein n=1 Tax=Alloalcanivorax profundimaris TaxID=2735259 RepID=A0ABS0ANA8_9GAMM|nr:hypothetical protein [Alloalcanivorax profundimaris]